MEKGGTYDLLPAGSAAFEKGLFDVGLGRVLGSWRELLEIGDD